MTVRGLTIKSQKNAFGQQPVKMWPSSHCPVRVERVGYPGAYVARFLGVTTSAVVRAANSQNLVEIGKYQ